VATMHAMTMRMTLPTAHVPLPDLAIDAQGTARSGAFGDVYFSALGGVAETQHVFLAGNNLPTRWLTADHFTIGELGFGTGLNFLVTWQAFTQSGAKGMLHYVAVEKFPLSVEQFVQALAHYPDLAPYAQQLLAQYPLRLPGMHRLQFGRVSLTLCVGDAEALLPQTQAAVDAWFLDGFSPAKNESMWNDGVLREVARLSAPHATLATFTVAGGVRRGLEAVGFTVQKTKGYAHKREMLVGSRHGECSEVMHRGVATGSSRGACHDVVVIGAGIAGCTVARALAERGLRVTVLDALGVASGASGNKAAVLYPQLTKFFTPATAWHFTGYGFMLRKLAQWKADGLDFTFAQPGMLKIGKDKEDDARLRSIRESLQLDPAIAHWVQAEEASDRVGQTLEQGGFWYPHGTWLAPAELCAALLQHENITMRVARAENVTAGHVMLAGGERVQTAHIVLANAQAAQAFLPQPLAMGISAGQVSYLEAAPLNAILCHKGYAIAHPEGLLLGATYDRDDVSGAVTAENHAHNCAEFAQALPHFMPPKITGGRTALRATTPHRLPYVGQMQEGLWCSIGHGSRGMLSAPLAAELIAAQIGGEPLPVTAALRDLVSPLRQIPRR